MQEIMSFFYFELTSLQYIKHADFFARLRIWILIVDDGVENAIISQEQQGESVKCERCMDGSIVVFHEI